MTDLYLFGTACTDLLVGKYIFSGLDQIMKTPIVVFDDFTKLDDQGRDVSTSNIFEVSIGYWNDPDKSVMYFPGFNPVDHKDGDVTINTFVLGQKWSLPMVFKFDPKYSDTPGVYSGYVTTYKNDEDDNECRTFFSTYPPTQDDLDKKQTFETYDYENYQNHVYTSSHNHLNRPYYIVKVEI